VIVSEYAVARRYLVSAGLPAPDPTTDRGILQLLALGRQLMFLQYSGDVQLMLTPTGHFCSDGLSRVYFPRDHLAACPPVAAVATILGVGVGHEGGHLAYTGGKIPATDRPMNGLVPPPGATEDWIGTAENIVSDLVVDTVTAVRHPVLGQLLTEATRQVDGEWQEQGPQALAAAGAGTAGAVAAAKMIMIATIKIADQLSFDIFFLQ